MHVPRKRFGQHFLHDRNVIERIVTSISASRDDLMIEIGPGLGALTGPLLQHLDHLHAVEIDRDAIRHLEQHIDPAKLTIHEGDALRFDLATVANGPASVRLVGNLPYNISTPLLFHLLGQRELIREMHFMLQKEVVDRMAAGANDEAYGRLSVMLAPWVRVEPLFDIGPGAFRPPPKVTSTVVRLTPHEALPLARQYHKEFAQIVAAAFSQRRKTLRNSLRTLLSIDQITSTGIDPGARPEVLSPAQFSDLAQCLNSSKATTPSNLHTSSDVDDTE
jgi:16S rRNA (adenine1518-N6/adenine1519-N6)-dimethyltransferase